MLGYEKKIEEFIDANWKKGDPEEGNHWWTTAQVLSIFFTSFPDGCIDDYEVNEILEDRFARKFFAPSDDMPVIYWVIDMG